MNQLKNVIKMLSHVAYVTLSFTVLSHALNYVSPAVVFDIKEMM